MKLLTLIKDRLTMLVEPLHQQSAQEILPENPAANTLSIDDIPLNPATFVDTADLIMLRPAADRLDIQCQNPALSSNAGQHISRFRGRGMDYQESRSYQAGDDIRHMDWRVTARAGRPHTKLYQEERERPVVIVADFGSTMFFGSQSALKSVVAARIAALLGWAAVKNNDRVGGLLFNGGHQELRPKGGKAGVLALIRGLVRIADPRKGFLQKQASTSLNDELKRLQRLAKPGSLVFLISDCYGMNKKSRDLLLRLKRRVDVVVIQVIDPLEIQAPPPALYGVTDGRKSGVLDTRSKPGARFYNQYFSHHHHALKALLRQLQIPLLAISTADDVETVMQRFFTTDKRQRSVKQRISG